MGAAAGLLQNRAEPGGRVEKLAVGADFTSGEHLTSSKEICCPGVFHDPLARIRQATRGFSGTTRGPLCGLFGWHFDDLIRLLLSPSFFLYWVQLLFTARRRISSPTSISP